MSLGVVFMDAGERILFANSAAEGLLSLRLDRVWLDPAWQVFQKDGTLFSPEALPTTVALKTGKAVNNVVMGVFNPDLKGVRWLEVCAVPLFCEGEASQVFVTLQDVTDQRRAEEDLRESQSNLQLLLDSTAEAIYGIELRGLCTFCNTTFLKMMGYASAREVLGKDMHDLIHHSYPNGDPFPVESCRIFSAFQEGQGTHVDDEVLWRANGTCFPAEYWSFPQVRDGQVVGAVVTFVDITERKSAEQALQESRETLSRILDAIPQSVFWKDRESRYLGCNRAFARQVGLEEPAQIVGKTDFDLPWPLEEARSYVADDREVMENNRPKWHIIEPLQQVDGTRIWIDTTKVPLLGPDGQPFGVLGIYEDTTERKRLEDALKASEIWHRAILDTTMDGYMVLGQDGQILQTNETYARMTGYGVDELTRMRVPDLEVVEAPHETAEHIDHIFALGRHRFETRQRRKDGQIIDLEVSVQVLPGREKQLLAFMRDITKRKTTEEAILANQKQLAEAQALAHMGSWEMDLKTRALSWSEEFYRIFGLDFARDPATLETFLRVIHPEDREEVEYRFYASVTSREPYRFTHRLLLADGTVKFVDVWGQATYDVDGTPLHAIGTVLDITELKLAEEQQRQLTAQLQQAQKLESLGSLAGGVAHDLNNVLAAILSLSTSLRDRFVPPDPVAKSLDTITQACTRGRDVVRSLLVFARRDLEVEGFVDLNGMVKDVVHLLSHTTLKRVNLVTDLQEGLPGIRGDASALNHVLINLCVNATDAMDGGGSIIFTTGLAADGEVILTVQDTGSGMSPEVLKKAMEPFFTTKPPGKGTGLGLSMAYGTMQAHDGTVTLRSQLGEGTEVELAFPAARVMASPLETPAPAPAPVIVHEPFRKRRILLVDDDELIQESVGSMLEVLGAEVFKASGGQEAIRKLESGLEVELVILDMNMPEMSGAAALPRILAVCPQQKVLIASGYLDSQAKALLDGYPTVSLIGKPFSLSELKRAIR